MTVHTPPSPVRHAGRPAPARSAPGTGRVPGRSRRWLAGPMILLIALAVSTIYPIVFVVFTAFKTPEEYARSTLAPPSDPTTEYLHRAWTDGKVADLAVNSLIVVVCAVLLILVASATAGWALASMRFPLRGLTLFGIVAMMLLPPSVLMIPVFGVVRELGLVNDYLGLVLVYASLHIPFATYLMTSYLRGIPRELTEAATCDGAGAVRVFTAVALPLARPALLTVATLTFLWLWNELLFGLLILQAPERRTLMVGLASLQGQFSTDPPLLAAGMLLTMLPAVLVFVLFQRNLASGLTAGSVK